MSTMDAVPAAVRQPGPLRRPWLLGAGVFVAVLALVKLALHLYAGRHYGYFVDELYYLACAGIWLGATSISRP